MNERRTAGERFLKTVKDAWQDHQLCMAMLADVLMYMVRELEKFKTIQMLTIFRNESTALTTEYHRYTIPR